MQYPVCNKEMIPYQEEPCYSFKRGVVYKRIRYQCQDDDVWGKLEIPQGTMSEEQKTSLQVVKP